MCFMLHTVLQQQPLNESVLPAYLTYPCTFSCLSRSSIVCQRKDWGSNHKFECDNLQKLAAAHAAAPAAASGNSSGHPASSNTLCKPPPPDPNEDAPVPRQVLFSYQHYLQLCHNRTSCRRPPIGLTNHGNNCYANSALQCLLASRPLRAYLDQGLHSRDCNKPGNEWCLLCQLQVRLKTGSAVGFCLPHH
jgi:ubiquitin carboxyl-terminal hydrolase 36/42